jgi:DNA-binding MarR family transcriptional regulator
MNNPNTTGFVSSYLLYLLASASESASKQFHVRVREMGLRVPEWRVMACLYDQDGLMITQLAHYALMEQSRITRIVDQMETRGLVVRRNDKGDGRRVRIYLTGEGQSLSAELVDAAKTHEMQLLEGLSSKDAANIKPALMALLSSLETASSSGS